MDCLFYYVTFLQYIITLKLIRSFNNIYNQMVGNVFNYFKKMYYMFYAES